MSWGFNRFLQITRQIFSYIAISTMHYFAIILQNHILPSVGYTCVNYDTCLKKTKTYAHTFRHDLSCEIKISSLWTAWAYRVSSLLLSMAETEQPDLSHVILWVVKSGYFPFSCGQRLMRRSVCVIQVWLCM